MVVGSRHVSTTPRDTASRSKHHILSASPPHLWNKGLHFIFQNFCQARQFAILSEGCLMPSVRPHPHRPPPPTRPGTGACITHCSDLPGPVNSNCTQVMGRGPCHPSHIHLEDQATAAGVTHSSRAPPSPSCSSLLALSQSHG